MNEKYTSSIIFSEKIVIKYEIQIVFIKQKQSYLYIKFVSELNAIILNYHDKLQLLNRLFRLFQTETYVGKCIKIVLQIINKEIIHLQLQIMDDFVFKINLL